MGVNGMKDEDKELYELCKEVHKRTGWDDTFGYWTKSAGMSDKYHPYISYPELERRYGLFTTQEVKVLIPLYTTDYLLEKLPNILHGLYLTIYADSSDDDWIAVYERGVDEDSYRSYGDTPLKALLKLVLALNDAGVKL
jgi:hypothetical protein